MADRELEFSVNKLILGDNLEILKSLDSESVDLIYLDPPFFSNRHYEVIADFSPRGDKGEIRSFEDRWAGNISHYIEWLKERVIEMRRILKPTGSIFLHCDWHADAYIRVYILDKIFGEQNFRGQIIWKRYAAHSLGTKNLDMISDSIYIYSKSNIFVYHIQYGEKQDMKADGVTERFPRIEPETGRRFQDVALEQSSNKSSKDEKRIIQGKEVIAKMGWRWTQDTFDQRIKENPHIIYWTKTGRPRYKIYADEYEGLPLGNVWDDIPAINTTAKERIGYPTQKPEALLERIINMASNKGDIVIDPFMGGGTTIAAADRLNRQWIGIDQSPMAVKVTEFRLQNIQDDQPEFVFSPYTVQLYKYDYDTLRYKDAFAFESWIIQQFGGTGNIKQRGDKGIDGKAADGAPIQVKRSDNVPRDVIDKFPTAAKRYDAHLFEKNVKNHKPAGYMIAFSFGRGAIEEVSRLNTEENIIIKLVKVEDIVPIAIKPNIAVHVKELSRDEKKDVRQIELIAVGDSPAGIEFYSWDFNYNPEKKKFKAQVLLDKEGKQIISIKPGTHNIACKVVDNDGLENMETVKLTINGTLKRE
jgi:DNA modification methylase